MKIKVGDKLRTWFSGRDDGISTLLAIQPYTGSYPQWFTHVGTFSAENTRSGTLEMTIDERTWENRDVTPRKG